MTSAQRKHINKELAEIKLGQASLNHINTMIDWRITMLLGFIRHVNKKGKRNENLPRISRTKD